MADLNMTREQLPAVSLFSIGMIALGVICVVSRDFAYSWQPVPAFHPGREAFAIICGLFMITVSAALLVRSTVALAARAIFLFLLAWLCLKVPAVIASPRIEGVWIGFGEIGMLLAGGLVLFACLSGLDLLSLANSQGSEASRIAQIIFGLAVIPVGSDISFMCRSRLAWSPPGCLSVPALLT
jgi:uncharacterized membrane protein